MEQTYFKIKDEFKKQYKGLNVFLNFAAPLNKNNVGSDTYYHWTIDKAEDWICYKIKLEHLETK